MKIARCARPFVWFLFAGLLLCASASAAVIEPAPDPAFRALPGGDGQLQTWYLFNDSVTDGILAPGDTKIDSFVNWWTPVSGATQHNYEDGPYGGGFMYDPNTQDMPSGPMNFASRTDSSANYWLPMAENEMHFYLTYSQFDNNDFSTFYDANATLTQDQKDFLAGRNMKRNGWAMGWITNAIVKQNGQYVYDGTVGGNVAMDIFVHDGANAREFSYGEATGIMLSDPQISMSNDISNLANDGTQWHPPAFDEAIGSYDGDTLQNQLYRSQLGLTESEFGQVVDSMEIRETDPLALGAADVIWGDRRPSEIAANLTDHAGNPYTYSDTFADRSQYVVSTNDGGVIAGLSGFSAYSAELENWGDQQVIRIDISPETLLAGEGNGGIRKIVFYDFGVGSGTSQINPRAIELFAENGQLFALDNLGGRIYFPENRVYIALVDVVPEPSSIALLGLGGVLATLRRRRSR